MVQLKFRPHILQAHVDLRLPHLGEHAFKRFLAGAGMVVTEVLLDPAHVGGRHHLLTGRLGKLPLVAGINFLLADPEDAGKALDQCCGDSVLLAGGLLQAADKGAGLKPLVCLVRLIERLADFLHHLLLRFNGRGDILLRLLRSIGSLPGIAEAVAHFRHVGLRKFLHRLQRLRHFLKSLFINVSVPCGTLHQLLHALRQIPHALGILGLRLLLRVQSLLIFLLLELLTIQPFKPLVLVQQVQFPA